MIRHRYPTRAEAATLVEFLTERLRRRPKGACERCWDVGKLSRATLVCADTSSAKERKLLCCEPCFRYLEVRGWARRVATVTEYLGGSP